jgi:hypothetical protein
MGYVNNDGYYITARPSDVGNITYQTSKEAEELLVEIGYEDGDDIPWGVINPLRAAGLVYTNGQGVDDLQEGCPILIRRNCQSYRSLKLRGYWSSLTHEAIFRPGYTTNSNKSWSNQTRCWTGYVKDSTRSSPRILPVCI